MEAAYVIGRMSLLPELKRGKMVAQAVVCEPVFACPDIVLLSLSPTARASPYVVSPG